METPVLSKGQKKISLSGKKAKKDIIKNVVVDPHKSYWPLVESELESLTIILRDNLPRIKPVKVNVPWRLLKDVSKQDRKKVRESYITKHCPVETITKEDNLIFGVNEIARLLEANACSIVLVANMSPRIVVKHIIEMSVLHNVPVLVVPTLKQILKEHCGLESMAISIKREYPEEKKCLENIVKAVVDIHKNYPHNNCHINATRSAEIQEQGNLVCDNLKSTEKKEQKIINCHLMKASNGERAFIPEYEENVSENTKDVMEFENLIISKKEEPLPQSEIIKIKKKINKKSYKALVVKRLKGNKDRQKDKNKKMKKK